MNIMDKGFKRDTQGYGEYHVNDLIIWAAIKVSENNRSDKGYVALNDFWVKFPRCKAPKQAGSPMIIKPKAIFSPLWDYNGRGEITIDQLNNIINTCPVISDKCLPYTITDEIIDYARQHNRVDTLTNKED